MELGLLMLEMPGVCMRESRKEARVARRPSVDRKVQGTDRRPGCGPEERVSK